MGTFRVSGASIIGPHHKKRGELNQDAYSVVDIGDTVIIAAADGAGSLEKSHLGAELAVRSCSQVTAELVTDGKPFNEAVREGVTAARDKLLVRDDWKLIGCTLSIAVLNTDGSYATAIVGDAFTVITLKNGEHVLYQPEKHAEYANVTRLLTSKEFDPLIISSDDTGDMASAISVSTDGLEGTSLKGGHPSRGFWDPVVKRVSMEVMDMNAFLQYMDSKGKLVDDTTLVVAALKA